MMTLEQVRQKYPAYQGVPDRELADALYNKFYDGKIDRAEYDQKLGLAAPQAPAQSAAPAPQPADEGLGWLDYVPGVSLARDVADIYNQGLGPNWELPASVGARHDAQSTAAVDVARGAAHGATFNYDDELIGLLAGEDAKQAYRDRTAEEGPVASTIGQLGSALLPGGGVSWIGRGATAGARALRGAIAGGAQSALAGSGAAQGGIPERAEAAYDDALVGALLGGATGRFAGAPRATAGAQDAADLGIGLSQGQATRDLGQLAREEAYRNKAGPAQGVVSGFDQRQAGEIQDAAARIMPGAEMAPAASAGIAQGALRQADEAARAGVRGAYREFEQTRGFLDPSALDDLTGRTLRLLDDPFIGIGNDPQLRQRLAGFADAFQTAKARATDQGTTLQQVDGLRKSLNASINGARGPFDEAYRAGLYKIKETFDQWADDSISGALYSGDRGAIDLLRQAREMSSEYKARFGKRPGDPAGQIIGKLLDDQVTPDQAVNFLFGVSKLGKNGTAEALKRIGEASPEALDSLRQAGWARIVRDVTGETKSPVMIARSIETQLEQSPFMMQQLYGPEVVAKMRKLVSAIDQTVTPRNVTNPPRSGWTVINAFTGSLPYGLPVALGGLSYAGSGDGSNAATVGLLTGMAVAMSKGRTAVKAQRATQGVQKARPAIAAAGQAAARAYGGSGEAGTTTRATRRISKAERMQRFGL